MSTSVWFWSIIVDCDLGCPTRVSGGFLQSWARADSVVFVQAPWFSCVIHDSTEWLWYPSSEVCRVLYFVLYFVCFDALPCLILCVHAFVNRGSTAHAVPWCRRVFAHSCVHMFTCVVFTLGRLARFGCIGLKCAHRRLFIVWELHV